MKKIILVLAALMFSANVSMAQTAATTATKTAVIEKKKAEVIKSPEITEINKQIYQAKVANKPIDDLLKKKKEIILRIKAERAAAGTAVDKK